jgi:phospholipid/cholesterol/gamma-HCH transport system substrate-binding protein
MMRLRHTDEWIGLLVVIAVLLFLGVAFQAGVLSHWFRPNATLRVILPEKGSAGLSSGADVEVLGTKAGEVNRIVINPDQQMFAEAVIDEQARPFIRRDSVAVIRKRFGVAGAAYLDIGRGKGKALDWSFAVIQATTERDPTENIGTLIDQMREKVFPVLDDVGRTTHGLAEMVDNMKKGQGDVGRLLVDDTMVKQAEETVASARESLASIGPILAQLQDASRDIAELTKNVKAPQNGVPALLRRINGILVSLQGMMQALVRASQHLPQIAHDMEGSTSSLPSLLTQSQQTVHDLDQLVVQLRGSWLLGGGRPPATPPSRLPSTEVRP